MLIWFREKKTSLGSDGGKIHSPGKLVQIMRRTSVKGRIHTLQPKRNHICLLSIPFLGSENDWRTVIAQNCPAHTFFSLSLFSFCLEKRVWTHFLCACFWSVQLTGQAKLKGKIILDLSFLTELLKEKVFPPRTGVDPIPKLQGPAAETLDWYSFRQTLKNVSHSSRVHFLSAVFRAPSQHTPFSSSPFTLCIDKICNSNCPDPSDTCWRQKSQFKCKPLKTLYYKRSSFPNIMCTCTKWARPRTFNATQQAIKVHPGSWTEWPCAT